VHHCRTDLCSSLGARRLQLRGESPERKRYCDDGRAGDGDPDRLLAEDWVPEIPGINAPGNYMTDYAPDPWKVAWPVVQQAASGKYKHYFPRPSNKTTEH
jgi:hypothetical protein